MFRCGPPKRAINHGATNDAGGVAPCLDFVHDQLATGRLLRMLNVVNDVTRECLAAVVDTSISGRRVVRELGDLIARRVPWHVMGLYPPHLLRASSAVAAMCEVPDEPMARDQHTDTHEHSPHHPRPSVTQIEQRRDRELLRHPGRFKNLVEAISTRLAEIERWRTRKVKPAMQLPQGRAAIEALQRRRAQLSQGVRSDAASTSGSPAPYRASSAYGATAPA